MSEELKSRTPGPWTCVEVEFGEYQTGKVAFVVDTEAEGAEMVASVSNCSLISAAPDLLAALEDAYKFLGNHISGEHPLDKKIVAALVKAKGHI